ncbi:MAG: serine hydrolase [Candidatus Pacebacteria bacterium]|nr:serine hydrolase [Candidatus Paceibacterota bacterium]
MTGRLKLFLIAIFLSLPFWWGANLLERNLEDFFAWRQISRNPQIWLAQVSLDQKLRDAKPFRNNEIAPLELEGKAGLSLFLGENGQEKVLFELNQEEKLPIASLTKLMTAKVAIDNYDLAKEVTVSKEAILQEENFGKLQAGKVFEAKYLLYPLLMESSNDAAFSFAHDYPGMSLGNFVSLMNKEASELGLTNTFFANPSGLDPEDFRPRSPDNKINYSTAKDLVFLTKSLFDKPIIWEILSTRRYNGYGPELVNNNLLLDSLSGVIGGKTGYTGKAQKCMILVTRAPKNSGNLINVILGSSDNFGEMRKLVNWIQTAYKW